jgi:hypothetical protein
MRSRSCCSIRRSTISTASPLAIPGSLAESVAGRDNEDVRAASAQGHAVGLKPAGHVGSWAGGVVLGLLAVVVFGHGSAHAAKRQADPLSLGAIPPRPAAAPVRDRVIHRGRPGRRAAAAVHTASYDDGDGHSVTISVSGAYANPTLRAQELANFLGSLLHGDEMNRLTATIATPGELRRLCGTGTLGCYFPDSEELVVSGEESTPTDPPREFLIAHEYGHHVAQNRRNNPWSALARGTKRWSSYEGICRGIKRGRIHPRIYFQDPGEAFAEAYAFYHYPNVIGWIWDIARPDQGSFDAILEDVTSPWLRRAPLARARSFESGSRRDVWRLHTPLDGRLLVELDGPPGANFDLILLAGNKPRVLRRAVGPGAEEELRYAVCGKRAVRIVARRVSGNGQFEVTAARP